MFAENFLSPFLGVWISVVNLNSMSRWVRMIALVCVQLWFSVFRIRLNHLFLSRLVLKMPMPAFSYAFMVYTFWYLQITLFICSTWNEMLKKRKQTHEEYVHINSARITCLEKHSWPLFFFLQCLVLHSLAFYYWAKYQPESLSLNHF